MPPPEMGPGGGLHGDGQKGYRPRAGGTTRPKRVSDRATPVLAAEAIAKEQEFERIVQEIEVKTDGTIYRGKLALPW